MAPGASGSGESAFCGTARAGHGAGRPGCDRRTFVVRGLGALAAVALPWGCMAPVTPVPVRSGAIRLDPGEYPSLATPGGHLRLQPAGFPGTVYLLALEDGYAALSPICTHMGCTVDVHGERLVCPCHGSTYDRRGRVLRGPAPEALRSFPVAVEPGGTLVITLEES